jgi:hypothetical protein
MQRDLTPSSEGKRCPACSQADLIRIDTTTSHSERGYPMAIVACPSCNWREGWVRHNVTGQMMQLWRGRPRRPEDHPQARQSPNLSIYGRL